MNHSSAVTYVNPLLALGRAGGDRPVPARAFALLAVSVGALVAVAIAYPFALLHLRAGDPASILAVTLAGILCCVGLVLHGRRHFEAEAAAQVLAIAGLGAVFALADGALLDPGLAVAMMAPIHAAVAMRSRLRRHAWTLPAGVAALSGAAGLLGAGGGAPALAVPALVAVCGLVAFAALRSGIGTPADTSQARALKHLLDSVDDGVLRFAGSGEVAYVSRSTERILKCKRYELTGVGLAARIHVADRPAYLQALSRATRAGVSGALELRLRRDAAMAGQPAPFVWMELSLWPVMDRAGGPGPHEAVALLRDITDRKDAELAAARLRRQAEDASHAKSRFLATIGHELRTPLNAIVGFSDMMLEGIGGTLEPAHKDYAGLIKQSGHHLVGVVNMLLDMSKIEAGRFELQIERFRPQGLVAPCMTLVEQAATERGVTLVETIAPDLPEIAADERACRQILINLLANAVKFSDAGGAVSLSMKRQGRMINLAVADTGIGMAPDAIQRVGEPFFQAQDGLARRYEGTGLGLSIVKGLVDLHGGKLHIASESGVGTTVTVLLPIEGPSQHEAGPAPVHRLPAHPVESPTEPWPERKSAVQ